MLYVRAMSCAPLMLSLAFIVDLLDVFFMNVHVACTTTGFDFGDSPFLPEALEDETGILGTVRNLGR